jgi:hypothetical protein
MRWDASTRSTRPSRPFRRRSVQTPIASNCCVENCITMIAPALYATAFTHGVFLINPINQIMIMITATIHTMCKASEVTASVRRAITQITINSTAIQSSECFILLNHEPSTGCAYCWVLSYVLFPEQSNSDL